MGLISEFKTFINRGNVIDLAVGVIIGGAFATITKSLTDDLIMPVVGYVFGGADFSRYFIRLGDLPAGFKGNPESYGDLKAAGVAMFGWGEFLTVFVNFLILAFIIFLLVKAVNKLMPKPDRPLTKSAVADSVRQWDCLAG
ncbi:large conductance mechanosensitive channel [Sphingobium indicum UT26S]|uniref:Large-conductance mechanosensitive channel n=1 Tax=Sphingobium indicum (strain DSM 16413 / CCM 7287 / MTCC 6362 / UT26 / NBRC 101211 / UT26S) TaxID=452662 RepID=D4YZU2_SPHIU|nr:large conductance mechanosensitive channel protein MscL [Sphingobium indicum]BAI95874.1 large conductance mechanosensitive channel [Sphingobium indicum UT26S]